MRALTLTQPWAQLMADGRKHVETRSWRAPFTLTRGEVYAIHAAKGWQAVDRDCAEAYGYEPADLKRGVIVALVEHRGCHSTELFEISPRFTREERSYGDYSPGRYGWVTNLVLKLPEPIPCTGKLGLWYVPADVEAKIDLARKVALG